MTEGQKSDPSQWTTPPGPPSGNAPGGAAAPPQPAPEEQAAAVPPRSLLRSGALMALGTIFSRVTGLLRTTVIAAALGAGLLGDAYNTANTVPNIVYDLLLGGILTSVIVPLLVRAREREPGYGERYEQRVFTLAVIFLGGLTAVAMLLAPVLISVYASSYTGDQRDVAVLFAYFFLPQIFFYGVGAFAGAILNTRGSFAAPMWAPVLNNIVLIIVGVVFLLLSTGQITPSDIGDGQFLLLALGTTGGIVLQTVVLWPALRGVGFRWRPRLDFQRGEVGQVGRMAGWTLIYVIATQAGFAVVTRLANRAGNQAVTEGLGGGHGFTAYTLAYQIFQLPYAIVAVSVITALLPRMSEHAAEGKTALVRDDFSSGLRLASVIILPTAALMLVLAPEITTVLLQHGNMSHDEALMIARILQVFAVALVPFSIYQLMLRVFYAYGDTRTPALVSLFTVAANIAVAFTVYAVVDTGWIVVGLAVGFVVANFVGALISWAVLRRKLGGVDGRRIVLSYLKLMVAIWPLIGFAYATHAIVDAVLGTDFVASAVSLIIGAAGGGILYVVFARLLRVSEVQTLLSTVGSRLPGRR